MTPGAHVAAKIEVLEAILLGVPAEKALTNWGRSNRFAGSKDRANIRDLVFQAIRCRRSAGAWPNASSARAWAIGALRANDVDPAQLFTGIGHSPTELKIDELEIKVISEPNSLDIQDWTAQNLKMFYGDTQAHEIAQVLRHRAPISIRTNLQKTSLADLQSVLASADIDTSVNPVCETALTVLSNPRRVVLQEAFAKGWFELQDAASQAVTAAIPIEGRVLDYCAGGGGKSLALAGRSGAKIFAHDIDLARMTEIPTRAARGGHDIEVISPCDLDPMAQFDTVVCDLPCTGSGAWRRSPEGKWKLKETDLIRYCELQRDILAKCSQHVAAGGTLALITCSIFEAENQLQRNFLVDYYPELSFVMEQQYLPSTENDGLYLAVFKKFA
tara:strand:+ start:1575 stop:2735 length:1161 start_codon:yes stop_codon:yes gene_type:complete